MPTHRKGIFKSLAFTLLIFVATWISAFLKWRSDNRVPSGQDLVVFGGGLPLLLSGIFWGARATIEYLHRPAKIKTPSSATEDSTTTPIPDETLTWTVGLLDSSLLLPAGSDAGDVAAVAASWEPAELYNGLQDSDGSPIFAACVSAVPLDAFDETLSPSESPLDLDDEQRRALLLGADATHHLLERHAVIGETDEGSTPASIELHLILPRRWKRSYSTMAAWLSRALASDLWRPVVGRPQVTLVSHAAQALGVIDRLLTRLHEEPAGSRIIVLACDSWLSERTVSDWEQSGQLFGRKNYGGRTPGEGACALLLGHADEAMAKSVAQIHRLVAGDRGLSIDKYGRQRDEGTLAKLLDRAREQTITPAVTYETCALVSDADQRTGHNAELIKAIRHIWPDELEPQHRCLPLGYANGESGAVLALSALAVAATQKVPTFAITLSDAKARAVMLVSPPEQIG